MSEPWFWRGETIGAQAARAALMPAAALYDAGQRLRWRLTAPRDPGVPVICVGNAIAGGAGKTPFCLTLQRLLEAEGVAASFLTRGHRGALKGPVLVDARHRADEAGDEALLLAAAAQTWIAKDRAAGAVAAAAAGARTLIMDDGFQNPTVKKTLSFLILSGEEEGLAPFPAGPLREPLARAIARADALVIRSPAPAKAVKDEGEPPEQALPVDACFPLVPQSEGSASIARQRKKAPRFAVSVAVMPSIPPQRAIAFCGIARPQRFFSDLERAGFILVSRHAFADHHPYGATEIASLRASAKAQNAALITTEKDLVRLSPPDRSGIAVARLTLTPDDPAALVRFVREGINR